MACQQPLLPIRNFRLLNETEIMNFDMMAVSDFAEKGYLVENSLSYPAYLHDEHN